MCVKIGSYKIYNLFYRPLYFTYFGSFFFILGFVDQLRVTRLLLKRGYAILSGTPHRVVIL